MSPRYAARKDNTQTEIVEAMRGVGAAVTFLHRVGHGVGDVLVSFRMRWHVIEIKSPGGTLTEDEWAWIGKQRAEVHVCETVEQALEAIGAVQPARGDAR